MADDQTGRGGDGQPPRFRSRLGPPPSRRAGKLEEPERLPRREDTSLAPVRRAPDAVEDVEQDDSPGFGESTFEPTQVGANLSALREALLRRRLEREAAEAEAAKQAAEAVAAQGAAADEDQALRAERETAAVEQAAEAAAREAAEQAAGEIEESEAREASRPAALAGQRVGTLVFDAAAIRRALDEVEDAVDLVESPAPADSTALEDDAPGSDEGPASADSGHPDDEVPEEADEDRAPADTGDDGTPSGAAAAPGGALPSDESPVGPENSPAAAPDEVSEGAVAEAPGLDAGRGEDWEAAAPDPDPDAVVGDGWEAAAPDPDADGGEAWGAADGVQDGDGVDAAEELAAALDEEPLNEDLLEADEEGALPLESAAPEDAKPVWRPAADTLLVPPPRDVPATALSRDMPESAGEGLPTSGHAAWEDGPAQHRSATLVLTGDALAEALSARLTDDELDDGADDEAMPRQGHVAPTVVEEVPLDDPDLVPGPVEVVAERTEVGLAPDEVEPEPEWTRDEASERDTLMVRPERFWSDLAAAADEERTSVELAPADAEGPDDGPTADPVVPPMSETSPGFGIGSVDIDDLDPSNTEPASSAGASLRKPITDLHETHARATSPSLDAEWSSRARSMDTQILAMDPSEPAWADGDVSAPDLDARSVLGPVGPAVARPSRRPSPAVMDDDGGLSDSSDDASTLQHQGATSFLRAMVVLGLLVLLGAFSIPTAMDGTFSGPLATVSDPQSLSFLVALLFVIEVLVAAIPMPLVVRAGLLTVASATHLGFGAMLLHAAALRDAFHAQPAVDLLFASGAFTTTLALLTLVLLPAGLYARGRYPASLGARVTVGIGAALGLFALLAGHLVATRLGGVPLMTLIDQVTGDGSLQGDRFAAIAVLAGLVALPLSFVAFLGPRRTGLASFWAFLWCFLLGAALIVEAAHVVHLEQWLEVLEPVRLTVFFAAGLLVAPVAFGTLVGALSPGRPVSPASEDR